MARKSLRNTSILGMTAGDLTLYVLLLAAAAIQLFLDAVEYILPEGWSPPRWLFWLLFVAGLLAIGIAYRSQVRQSRAKIEQQLAEVKDDMSRLAIQNTLETAAGFLCALGVPTDCRVNVMVPVGNQLRILFHHKMGNARDLAIRLEKRQGCAGHAWTTRNQTCADLKTPSRPGAPRWGLNAEQEAMTSDIGAILSTPILHPTDARHVLGVFSIDTVSLLQEARFRDQAVSDRALSFASLLGVWLRDVDIEKGL